MKTLGIFLATAALCLSQSIPPIQPISVGTGNGGGGGSSSGVALQQSVTQNNGFVLGEMVANNGSTFVAAQTNSGGPFKAPGMLSAASGTAFTEVLAGYISGLTGVTDVNSNPLVAGTYYWISDATAGKLTSVAPSTTTSVLAPAFYAYSATTGIVNPPPYFSNTLIPLASLNGGSTAGVLQTTSGGVITASVALVNGTTATTQSVADNTTDVATDAFVLANAGGTVKPFGSTFIHYTQSDGLGSHTNNLGFNIAVDGSEAASASSATQPNMTVYTTTTGAAALAGIKPNGGNDTLSGTPTMVVRAALGQTTTTLFWAALSNDGSPMSSGTGISLQYCAGICYDTLLSDTDFMYVCYSGVSTTRYDSGVPADTAIHTFQMAYTPTSVTFSIDGANSHSVTTNIPSSSVGAYGFYCEINNLTSGAAQTLRFETSSVSYP